MIKKLIQTYHKIYNISKLQIIERIMGEENFFREEVTCFDDGRVEAGIRRLQKDYAKISEDIKFLEETSKKAEGNSERLNFLRNRQYEMMRLLTFEASQNEKNIDTCLNVWGEIDSDFRLCLEGLKLYFSGNPDASYMKLKEYLKKHDGFGSHYLLNKIYGLMLYEKKRYGDAEKFLYLVTQIKPEDIDTHKMMVDLYHRNNNASGETIERNILLSLGEA
ncbi:MAG: hypothetical protein MR959_04430 [Selenomonas bovis]|nr:hypothetical protein [Selenomonas bovis]